MFKKYLRIGFELLLWLCLLLFLIGGIRVHDKLRFTYLNDLWCLIAFTYLIGRIFKVFSFRQTYFGKNFLATISAIPLAFKQRSLSPFTSLSWPSVIFLGTFLYSCFLFLFIPILSFWSYGNSIFDLGIIDNSIYNMATRGRFETFNFTDGVKPFLYIPNNHLNLGLLFFAGIYRFFPYTEIILFTQSLALLLSAIPLYLLADKILPKEFHRMSIVVLFFLWDPIYRMNVWDFHEPPFMIFFALWSFYFIEVKKIGPALLFGLLMAIWREDGWWTFAALSVYLGIKTQKWKLALPAAICGLVIFPIHAGFFNHINTVGDRYAYLGTNLQSAIHTTLTKPWIFLGVIRQNISFFVRLVISSGGGFLFSGWSGLVALPGIFEVGLSQSNAMRDWNNHYIGLFTGPLFAATAYGWRKLYSVLSRKTKLRDPAYAIVGVSIALALTQLTFNVSSGLKMTWDQYEQTRCNQKLEKLIPPHVPLIATDPFSARLSHRYWIMSPNRSVDQTIASWMIAKDPELLNTIGLEGLHPARPWRFVQRACGYYVATRDAAERLDSDLNYSSLPKE